MVEPLPKPSVEVVSALHRRLIEREIELPLEVIAVVAAAYLDYLKTPDGVQFTALQMGLQFKEGDKSAQYRMVDGFGNVKQEIKAGQLGFVSGVYYKGMPLGREQLEITERNEHICEDCGTKSHCPKEVWDPLSADDKILCNSCLLNWPDPRVRSEGDRSACGECPAIKCPSHPTRMTQEAQRHEQYQYTG